MNTPRSVGLWLNVLLAAMAGLAARADNWPQWRGPQGDGVCAEKNLPITWNTHEHVRWKVALPDRGNSTPIVWNTRIFLTQALEKQNRQTLMSLDRADGRVLWQTGVTNSGKEPTHDTNPTCSGSPATDGERVIVSFGSAGLHCYDFAGRELWQRDLGKQVHMWGVSSSPVLHEDICFLNFGPGNRTFLMAVNKKTGRTLWQHDEPGGAADKYIGSWSTPIVIRAGGREELVITFPGRVAAFDPRTGRELWTCRGLNPLVYTSPLYADGIVVAMGGFMGSALAVRAGGDGDVTATHRLWHIPKTKQRIGSGVISDGHIYILNDPGIAECFELKTGKLVWEERLKGPGARADNWSSLVLADQNLYAINQSGDGFVCKASPTFHTVRTNSLGELTRASVAVSDGELFIRTYKNLWCISDKAPGQGTRP